MEASLPGAGINSPFQGFWVSVTDEGNLKAEEEDSLIAEGGSGRRWVAVEWRFSAFRRSRGGEERTATSFGPENFRG